MTRYALLVLAASVVSLSTAEAVIHGGNPHLDFTVDGINSTLTEGEVDLNAIRVHHCGGGYTDYTVSETIDPVEGYGLDITGGDLCGVTVFWDTEMILQGTNSDGSYAVRYDEPSTYVALGDPTDIVALAPFTILSGVIHGGNPHINLEVGR